ncbi:MULTISPECIES: S8 family peptidase [unclassified Clostridium]|uniref:S8 family peptidase n=1 Tax=unclassified Clostridium TaxID=2614128 RepID=UPI000297D97C|nr:MULTISPECIES: S8 family peptidase [unclassified Clostridium]EKQ51424.1 MAG: subtilase family protease [Clostridium sp. Maddingley MBC34-26]
MDRSFRAPREIFSDKNYFHYVVQYEGNIEEEVSKQPGYYVTIINDRYAIISANRELELNIKPPFFSTIVYVATPDIYTLQEISPIEASGANFLQLELPLRLTGQGVDVAIIDTGIDYLNEEFIRENGETKIEYIWDQTITSVGSNENSDVPFGTTYDKNNIQEAINAFRAGRSPFDIVPSRDENGHGTNMAGIIGALGKNPNLKGMVPDCNFVIIKLVESLAYKSLFNIQIPIFDIVAAFTAIEFLHRYSLRSNRPMVIYFPLGSNLGSHRGNGILEQFMDAVSLTSGIAIVAPAGNQGASQTHTSGTVSQVNESRAIQLYISPEQKNIVIDIWVDSPNIMSLSIVSPSGESTGTISTQIGALDTYSFVFENTSTIINAYLPEEYTGDQLMRIRFFNVREGIWNLVLTGQLILDGTYNAWIPQEGVSIGGTRFVSSDPYGTVMSPGTSDYVLTAAAYNQTNNTILNYSGMGFLNDYTSRVDIAAGGVNALTVAPNNETAIINGTSVAGAVVTGACVMLFQWGIVEKNDPNIYSQTIKTYIQRGSVQRSGDIYPNPQWGYGVLNVLKMFQSMV